MTMAKQNKREISRIGPRLTKDPNSVEFAWQTLALMKSFYESKKVSEDRWLRLVSEADQYRIYDRIPEDKPYGSLDAMLKAEIGKTEEQARLEVVKQAKNAEPPAPNGRPRKGMNVTPLSKRGNDRFIARIARDRPDILKRMKKGEFKSVRSAAIEAGIVKVPTALDNLKKAWTKASNAQRQQFLQWIESIIK